MDSKSTEAFLIFLPFQDMSMILFLALAFLCSGTVKGFLGMGLPASAMGFLTLIMEPASAISLMVIPIIFTNFAQFFRSQNPLETAIKYRYFAVAIMVSIFFTSMFLSSYPTSFLTVTIGMAMIVFSIQSMFGINLPVKDNFKWHIFLGLLAGILGGLSAIWAPIVGMYLIARNYSKDQFIGISGFLFLSGCLPLAFGLFISGIMTFSTVLQSLIGLIFVLLGFRIGEILRNKISFELFRRLLLILFLILGSRLVILSTI